MNKNLWCPSDEIDVFNKICWYSVTIVWSILLLPFTVPISSLHVITPRQHSYLHIDVKAMVNCLQCCARFDRPGIRTIDLRLYSKYSSSVIYKLAHCRVHQNNNSAIPINYTIQLYQQYYQLSMFVCLINVYGSVFRFACWSELICLFVCYLKKTNSINCRQISRINWNSALKMITISFDHNRRRSNVFGNARFLILPNFSKFCPNFAQIWQILPQENFLRDVAASPASTALILILLLHCYCLKITIL